MSVAEVLPGRNVVEAATSPEFLLQGLYQRHSDRILGFCLRRLGSRQEAEDAQQNTFLYAFRALQRGVRPISETAWLFKIAENACLAAHRSNGRRRSREVDHDPELVAGVPAGESAGETAAALRAAVARLPGNQRRALLLREWQGLSYREIAAELGVSVAAVETLIFRARGGVARTLEREMGIRGRLAGLLDLGSLLGALKSAFTGAAAVNVAAAVAVLTLATLPAGDSSDPAGATAPGKAGTPLISDSDDAARPGEPGIRAGASGSRDRSAPRGGTAPSQSSRPGGSEDSSSDPGASGAPGAPGGAPGAPGSQTGATAPQAPVLPPLPEPLPRAVQPPTLPPVAVPPVPSVPQQLPTVPDLPAVPPLPVQAPDPNNTLPPLPKLP